MDDSYYVVFIKMIKGVNSFRLINFFKYFKSKLVVLNRCKKIFNVINILM